MCRIVTEYLIGGAVDRELRAVSQLAMEMIEGFVKAAARS